MCFFFCFCKWVCRLTNRLLVPFSARLHDKFRIMLVFRVMLVCFAAVIWFTFLGCYHTDGMLMMRARPPPVKDFIFIFQKFKLAINLLVSTFCDSLWSATVYWMLWFHTLGTCQILHFTGFLSPRKLSRGLWNHRRTFVCLFVSLFVCYHDN